MNKENTKTQQNYLQNSSTVSKSIILRVLLFHSVLPLLFSFGGASYHIVHVLCNGCLMLWSLGLGVIVVSPASVVPVTVCAAVLPAPAGDVGLSTSKGVAPEGAAEADFAPLSLSAPETDKPASAAVRADVCVVPGAAPVVEPAPAPPDALPVETLLCAAVVFDCESLPVDLEAIVAITTIIELELRHNSD